MFASYLGNFPAALALADEAQALASQIGSTTGLAYASFVRAFVAYFQADFPRIEPFAAEVIGLLQSAHARGEGTRPWIAAAAKGLLAMALAMQRRFTEGRKHFDEATAQARGIGEVALLGGIRTSAGFGAMLQGDLAEATAALTEGANALREAGMPSLSIALTALGEISLRAGDARGRPGTCEKLSRPRD